MRPCLSRRCVHTHTRDHLRALLRETAQSVAVVTARLPSASASASPSSYHGATLSSFTSIALDPCPLVAFSLRVPSRMASALNTHIPSSVSSSKCDTHSPHPHPHPHPHLVINVLSAAQPHLAERFARPDFYPRPFDDPRVPWSVSKEGLPILSGALGALSCALVGRSMSLACLSEEDGERTGLASELFIARVLRVESVPRILLDEATDNAALHTLPLLYHRRRYTTVADLDHATA